MSLDESVLGECMRNIAERHGLVIEREEDRPGPGLGLIFHASWGELPVTIDVTHVRYPHSEDRRYHVFVRLTLGQLEGTAQRWEFIQRERMGLQLSGGDGWLVLGTGRGTGEAVVLDDLDVLFELAGQLRHELVRERSNGESDLWRDWPFESLEQKGEPSRRWLAKHVLETIAFVGFIAVAGGLFVYVVGKNIHWIAAVVLSLLGLALCTYITRSVWRILLRQMSVRGIVEEAHRLLGSLVVFDSLEAVKTVPTRNLGYLIAGNMKKDYLPVRVNGMGVDAQSSALGLSLRLHVYDVEWHHTTLEQCRILPDTWAWVEVTGRSEQIPRVPRWSREERRAERVRWLFDSVELAEGELGRHLVRLGELSRTAGAYR